MTDMTMQPGTEHPRWFTPERRGWIAGIVGAALLGFAAGNGHTTQGAVASVSEQLGQAKVTANCEHKRADKSAAVATQAIVSNFTDAVPIPDPGSIPKNCPPPKK